jgi:EPS-associated MarR family transcriptional regulator
LIERTRDGMTNPEEIRYRILRALDDNPRLSQRDLAKHLGISLGKANYCLRALITLGWVKARNFRMSDNKRAYAYFLTPAGIEAKARVTLRFLRHKVKEYELIRDEIEELRREVAKDGFASERELGSLR